MTPSETGVRPQELGCVRGVQGPKLERRIIAKGQDVRDPQLNELQEPRNKRGKSNEVTQKRRARANKRPWLLEWI